MRRPNASRSSHSLAGNLGPLCFTCRYLLAVVESSMNTCSRVDLYILVCYSWLHIPFGKCVALAAVRMCGAASHAAPPSQGLDWGLTEHWTSASQARLTAAAALPNAATSSPHRPPPLSTLWRLHPASHTHTLALRIHPHTILPYPTAHTLHTPLA